MVGCQSVGQRSEPLGPAGPGVHCSRHGCTCYPAVPDSGGHRGLAQLVQGWHLISVWIWFAGTNARLCTRHAMALCGLKTLS